MVYLGATEEQIAGHGSALRKLGRAAVTSDCYSIERTHRR
jgi:hypothetical protein